MKGEILQKYEHNQSVQSISYRSRRDPLFGIRSCLGKAGEQSRPAGGDYFYGGHEVLWLLYSPKPRRGEWRTSAPRRIVKMIGEEM
jgi:hypothetical protein